MGKKGRLLDILEDRGHQRIILGICVILVLVLEVIIYFAAASQAGVTSMLMITDHSGRKVYETPGSSLTSYQQMRFEEIHGPLEDYQIQTQTESRPFPTRLWVSSAVGIPTALILLLAFLVRVYLALVYGESGRGAQKEGAQWGNGRFGSALLSFGGISVFHVGMIVLGGAILMWMVPDFLLNVLKLSMTAVREFKWLLLGMCIFVALLIVFVVYLRYKLSKQMMENQFNLDKSRLEQQLLEQRQTLLLPGQQDNRSEE